MPVRVLNSLQLFDQPILLASAHRHLNLGGKHLAAEVVHAPPRGNGTHTSRRIELELPDILFRKQENTARFIGGESSEIDIAVHAFIGNPQDLCRLFNRNISRNIWKLVDICHEASLVMALFHVN